MRSFDPQESADLAEGDIERVMRLLEAGDSLISKEDALVDAAQLEAKVLLKLDQEEAVNIDDAEARIARFKDIAGTHEREALTAAARANASDPWPPIRGAKELHDLAQDTLADLLRQLTETPDLAHKQTLSTKYDQLVARLEALSRRIESRR